MKQNELKILATWLGIIGLNLLANKAWNPDLHSGQLELLKQKFLKDANITRIQYDKMNSGWWEAEYYVGVSDDVMIVEGKEIKDCDLKIILNYAKSLKLK